MRKEIKATVKTVYCILSTMWIVLTFFLATLLTQTNTLDFTLKCEPDEVDANVSSDAILSCHVEPSRDLSDDFTKWTLIWVNGPKEVHVRRKGEDLLMSQHEQFKKRTQIDNEKLKNGTISLKIANISKNDTGNYTCLVKVLDEQQQTKIGSVRLHVVEAGGQDDQKIQSGTAVTPTTGKPQGQLSSVVIWVVVVAIGILLIVIIGLFVRRHRNRNARGNRGAGVDGDQGPQPPQVEPERVPLQDQGQEPNNREEPNPDDQEQDPLQNGNDAEPDE